MLKQTKGNHLINDTDKKDHYALEYEITKSHFNSDQLK